MTGYRVAFWWHEADALASGYDLCDDPDCWFEKPARHSHLPYMQTFTAAGVAS